MSLDAFYTPEPFAKRLLAAVQAHGVKSVADFAMGEGELLKAAAVRWPQATIFGFDINSDVVRLVKRRNPRWIARTADFFNEDRLLKICQDSGRTKFDIIVLNPPFSTRSQRVYNTELRGVGIVRSSKAMAFILRALEFCRKGTRIAAIVPASSRFSELDSKAWRIVTAQCQIEHLFDLPSNAFAGCNASAEALCLTVSAVRPSCTEDQRCVRVVENPDIIITRGRIPVHTTLADGLYPVIHTTDLVERKEANRFVNFRPSFHLCGPNILLPRVGRISRAHIEPQNLSGQHLSDCVIAISSLTPSAIAGVSNFLKMNWLSLQSLYRGTGAKYTTVARIGQLLASGGYTWGFCGRNISADTISGMQPSEVLEEVAR